MHPTPRPSGSPAHPPRAARQTRGMELVAAILLIVAMTYLERQAGA
jgi:hypothetical protein